MKHTITMVFHLSASSVDLLIENAEALAATYFPNQRAARAFKFSEIEASAATLNTEGVRYDADVWITGFYGEREQDEPLDIRD